MRTALLSTLLVTGAIANSGCGLISADFEGTIKVLAGVVGDDGQRTFESVELVDPNENADYRENKDKIKEGEITSIEVKIVRIAERNRAQVVVGQVDVRPEGAAEWTSGVAEWNGVNLEVDNVFALTLTPEKQAELNAIVFDGAGAIEMNLVGIGDTDPVEFDVEITLNMRFTASL